MKPLLFLWLCAALLSGSDLHPPRGQDSLADLRLLIHLVPKKFATLEHVDGRDVHNRGRRDTKEVDDGPLVWR